MTLEDSFAHVLKAYRVLTCYIVILSQGGDSLALHKAAARPLVPVSEVRGGTAGAHRNEGRQGWSLIFGRW